MGDELDVRDLRGIADNGDRLWVEAPIVEVTAGLELKEPVLRQGAELRAVARESQAVSVSLGGLFLTIPVAVE